METKTIKIEILVIVPNEIQPSDIDVSEVNGEYLAVTFSSEPSLLPRNFSKKLHFYFEAEEELYVANTAQINFDAPKAFVLFGGSAVAILEEDGIDALITEIYDNNLGYQLSEFTPNCPVGDILSAADGWTNFTILTPEQYAKLASL